MSVLTPNLSLTKPAGSEAADIAVINANMDILDNAATLAGSQTLTNKTLTSPHFTTPVVDSGGLTITSGGLAVSAGGATIIGATPSLAAALGLGTTTSASASAGGNGAVPAQVAGYWTITIGGSICKVPYFNT